MISITTPLPKPAPAPLDVIQAGKTAARQMRQRVETDTMGGDFEHLMKRIEAGFEAAVVLANAPPAGQPFTVIKGGRS